MSNYLIWIELKVLQFYTIYTHQQLWATKYMCMKSSCLKAHEDLFIRSISILYFV